MSDFVLDGSTALRWCLTSQQTTESAIVLGLMRQAEAAVPAVWPLEVANVLSKAINRGEVDLSSATVFLKQIASFNIAVHHGPIDVSELFTAARRHALTTYDASYVELALELRVPLVTEDAKMRAAAERAGVTLLV